MTSAATRKVHRNSPERAALLAEHLLREMKRYLPLLERIEAEPALWERTTVSLGIATLNGYRAAIRKAEG